MNATSLIIFFTYMQCKILYVSRNNYLSPLTGTSYKETHNTPLELQPFIGRSLLYTKIFLKQITTHVLIHVRI